MLVELYGIHSSKDIITGIQLREFHTKFNTYLQRYHQRYKIPKKQWGVSYRIKLVIPSKLLLKV